MAGNNLLTAKILKDGNTTKGGANALAEQYPGLYGAIQGLLGTAPDEVGGSVLDGSHQAQKAGADYGFPVGLLAQMSPLAKLTKGLPVGMSIKSVDGTMGLNGGNLFSRESSLMPRLEAMARSRSGGPANDAVLPFADLDHAAIDVNIRRLQAQNAAKAEVRSPDGGKTFYTVDHRGEWGTTAYPSESAALQSIGGLLK